MIKPNGKTPRLLRDRNTFEFFVKDPWGTSAIHGYRRACRHFGYHTLDDPTAAGSDDYRLLVSKNRKKLQQAAKVLKQTDGDGGVSDDLYWEKEDWLQSAKGLSWFSHDWKHWDWRQDRAAFKNLGWDGLITRVKDEPDDYYRVTIRRAQRGCAVKWVAPRLR